MCISWYLHIPQPQGLLLSRFTLCLILLRIIIFSQGLERYASETIWLSFLPTEKFDSGYILRSPNRNQTFCKNYLYMHQNLCYRCLNLKSCFIVTSLLTGKVLSLNPLPFFISWRLQHWVTQKETLDFNSACFQDN